MVWDTEKPLKLCNCQMHPCYAPGSEIIKNSKQGITKLGCGNGIPNVQTTPVDNQTNAQY